MDRDVQDLGLDGLELFGFGEFLGFLFDFEGAVEVLESCGGGEEEVGGAGTGELEEAFDDLMTVRQSVGSMLFG